MITFYRIYCKDPLITDCYVGSTTNIENRIKSHKWPCKLSSNIKVYNFIRENGGIDNWEFETVGYTPDDVYRYPMEDYYMGLYNSALNSVGAIEDKYKLKQKKKEWYETNKDEINKKRREANKDEINRKRRECRKAKKANK